MNVTISTQIRELLFVGLITDSDEFKSSAMKCQIFVNAACIVFSDIQLAQIIRKYFSYRTVVKMECEKIILEQMNFCYDNKDAYSVLPKNLYKEIGYR